MRSKIFLPVYFVILTTGVFGQPAAIYDTLTKPRLISRQFEFTEGASADARGNVFFTDQPNNKIWKYGTDGKLSVFIEKAGRANGTYFDKKGNLVVCADEHNQIWAIGPDKTVAVLLKGYKGKLMNGPNDIWIDSTGGIYMTDPYYQRSYWKRTRPDLPNQSIYYLPKGAAQPVVVDSTLQQPNGIVGTPDGKYLYVSDIGGDKTYKFTIDADGSLSGKTLFVDQGGDGITLDERGDFYICGKGITVYDRAGKQIAHIPVPEPWTANLCFGGVKKDVLFITASKAIYTLKMNVKGVE